MIEAGITEGINKFYFILKLNVFFWVLSILGIFVLGIGPAFLTIIELYQEFEWDYKELTWKNSFKLFKQNFKQGNQLSYSFLGIFLFFLFSLWTAGQLKGLIFLMISILMVFLLVVTMISWLFANVIIAYYDINLLNSLKLSFILFFKEIKASLSLIIISMLLTIITIKLPGLILFASVASLAVFLSRVGQKVFATLNFK